MSSKGDVLLIREASGPVDPYELACRIAGFEARSMSSLSFRPINDDKLHSAIARIERFGGVVLTSPRAAQRLADALDRSTMGPMRRVPLYCVGRATAVPLTSAGLAPVVLGVGTAASLAEQMPVDELHGPIFFPCSTRRRDELPAMLRARGVDVDELHVYEPEPVKWERIREGPPPDWAAFFSPMGALTVADVFIGAWSATRRAAIGPTTAEALRLAGLPPHAVAAEPTPEGLVAAIISAQSGTYSPIA